ncbi:MAG: hypothetical protein JO079_03560 [Frankiaceae bacterium]|nr:hypothetical protein [Frankiaceae bacterium]MBV9368184.1 hypothetical protein [Frankiales bacterium]
MTTTLARILTTGLALGLASAVIVPPNAEASPLPGRTIGGCSYDTNAAALSPGQNDGVEEDLSFTRDPEGLPSGATVSCKIRVNGVDAPGTEFSYVGFGLEVGANPISFVAGPTDEVSLCQRTVYADGVDTGWFCPGATTLQLPPQQVHDDIEWTLWYANQPFVWGVDPRVCPVLAAHPGTYGVVTVGPDGDVSVPDPLHLGLNPLYDCPPYVPPASG